MKNIRWLIVLALAAAWASNAGAELFVVRVGDGAAALNNASTAVFVDRFNNDGSVSASPTIVMPTVVSGAHQPFTNSGSATSEGALALSTDGAYLTLAGYAAAPGIASIASSTSAATSRVVGRIRLSDANVDTTTAIADAFSGNNIRSAVTSNGTDIWAVGGTSGVRYTTLGVGTTTQLSTDLTNMRTVDIFNNQLYASSASGAFHGVNLLSGGLAMASGQTTTLLPGFDPATSSPASTYGFWYANPNTLYVADDRTAVLGGGIQKWTFNSGSMMWSLAYTLATGAGSGSGARGLAGGLVGGNAVLYATTAEASANRLVSITDTGAGSMFNLLATAPTNTVFRGVEFVGGAITPTNNADFDNDGDVDGEDFLTWQQGLGQTGLAPGNKSTGDANGDGNVNFTDLDVWKTHFGMAPGTSAAGAVPEPAAIALGMLAAACGARLRRRRVGRAWSPCAAV